MAANGGKPGGVAGRPWRQRLAAWIAAVGLLAHPPARVTAADQADYRFESYQEDGGRIGVDTQGWLFDTQLASWISLKGQAVYDAISGATPTGAPPPAEVAAIGQLPTAGLFATVVRDGQPGLCVRCHESNALSGSGAPGMRPLTQLMHTRHTFAADPVPACR